MDPRHNHIVFAEGAETVRLLGLALKDSPDLGLRTDWNSFLEVVAYGRSAAVCLPELNGQQAERLKRLRSNHPFVPLALVTELSPVNLKAMNGMPEFDEILLVSEIDAVPEVLRRIAGRCPLLQAAAYIESLNNLPVEFAATLARACRLREPVRTVTRLASNVLGADRQTLWRLWCACAAPETKPRDFIDWLLVMHAVQYWHSSRSEREIARLVGVHSQTLVAALRRQFESHPLSEVAAETKPILLGRLRALLMPHQLSIIHS